MRVCSICGTEQGVETSSGLCTECLRIERSSARRTGWMIGAVILIAAVGVGGLITAMMLGMRDEAPKPVAELTKVETKSPPHQVEPQKDISVQDFSTYAGQVLPEIERVRLEMEMVWTGIKTFLQRVNAATDKSAIRTQIDTFREEMRQHAARFRETEERLQQITPPAIAVQEHKRLIVSISSYRIAVEGYVEGLATYRFEKIKQSQGSLEHADKEIREASAALATALD